MPITIIGKRNICNFRAEKEALTDIDGDLLLRGQHLLAILSGYSSMFYLSTRTIKREGPAVIRQYT